MVQVEIQTTVEWKVLRCQENLVAVCDLLGITLQAKDMDELQSLVGEAQHLLFIDLLEDGELPQFLHSRGWVPRYPLPSRMPDDGIEFDVPFRLVQAQA